MLGKIVWEKTGDEIKFSPLSPDLLIYYIENLNRDGVNSFRMSKTQFDVSQVEYLRQCLRAVKQVSDKIPFLIDDWDGDLFDQQYLNKLHRQWVQTGIRYPSIPLLLRKMNGLDKAYRDINSILHVVESSFYGEFKNYSDDPYQLENIFGTSLLDFNQSNITIGFDNLGRSSWDKFCHFDNNINDEDTNDFKKISGLLEVNLKRPRSYTPPIEYVEWCRKYNVPIVGQSLNVGNIINLEEKITDIRNIFVRNVNEQNDKFMLELCPN